MDGREKRWCELWTNESLYFPEKHHRKRTRPDQSSYKPGPTALAANDPLEPTGFRTAARQSDCNSDCRYLALRGAVLFASIRQCFKASRVAAGSSRNSGPTE